MNSTSTRGRTAATGGAPQHFLPHLQGLRAIAVLLVVIYHFWPGRLTGGYVGVDVFFVISGFLITQQLSRELERSGRIALPAFYAKRARRLLPAALTVLIFSALATLFIMPLSALGENVRQILASTFYIENWALAANAVDYLATSNDPSLVQHYWSLSVEEQFYLIWPLLLVGAAALGVKYLAQGRWKAMLAVVVVASVLSFGFSVVFTHSDPAQAYFVPFTRMWEFGVGGVLALAPRLRPTTAWLTNVLGYLGVIAILAAAFFYDRNTLFPGWAAVLPTVGAAAVIVCHRSERWYDIGRVLSGRPQRFIGDISYSLYLWHWPLIIIAPFIPGWGLSIYNRLALVVICFVLAWLTKKFIEDPVRTWQFFTARRPRVTFGFMVSAMAVTSLFVASAWVVQQPKYEAAASELRATLADPPECFGAASGPSTGTAARSCVNPALDDVIIPSPEFGNADRPDHPECLVTLNDSQLTTCHFGSTDSAAKRVALIGDSHAYALIEPFIQLATDNGWALTTYIKGGCPWNAAPLPGGDAFAQSCSTWRSRLSAALNDAPFDVIFTVALADPDAPGTSQAGQELAVGFSEAWKQVADQGVPVVAMVDNPVWAEDPNKCLRTGVAAQCTEPRKTALVVDPPVAIAAKNSLALGAKVSLLDFSDTYCGSTDCYSVIGGANVYRDQDHLTNTFAFTLAPLLQKALVDALVR